MSDVSVITSAYNGERYVAETVKSVLSQVGVGIEFIVIDDASQDLTAKVIADTIASSNNPFHTVKFIRHTQNQGILPSYCEGIRASTTPYFKILDHDDTLPDDRVLQKQRELLDSDSAFAFVSGISNYTDESSSVYASRSYPAESGKLDKALARKRHSLTGRSFFLHGSLLVRKEAYEGLGRALDLQFVIRTLASDNWEIAYLDEPVLNYRTHSGNESRSLRGRVDILKMKCDFAREFHKGRGKQLAQAVYWSFWELGKIAYSQVSTRRF